MFAIRFEETRASNKKGSGAGVRIHELGEKDLPIKFLTVREFRKIHGVGMRASSVYR